MNLISAFVLLLLCSCTTMVKTVSSPLDETRLFPNGKYHHNVTLTQADGTERVFEGVLSLRTEEIVLVALSSFGSTVFQVNDKKNAPLEVRIFYEPMQKYEKQFKDFYLSLKEILIRKNSRKEKKEEGTVTIGNKDKNGIPEDFQIVHPKFKVNVKVVGYEL